jgi:hypothetical protein
LPAIVRVHAAVFTVWELLLVAQAGVVVADNVALHRRLGMAGMVYGALVFAVGLLAFRSRSRPELHKRWIIAAPAALCGAALGRVVPSDSPQYLLLWLSPLLAMLVVDLVMLKRVHFIALVSGALLVVSFFKVPLLAAAIWQEIGAALLRPFV